jgi:hypothetical protein
MNLLKSTNGQNNVILMLLFALATYYGVSEDATNMLFTAGVSVVMYITEITKGQRVGKWSGNVISYVLAAGVAAFPWLASGAETLQPIIDYLFSGEGVSIGGLIGFAIPLINQIVFYFKNKPWIEGEGN